MIRIVLCSYLCTSWATSIAAYDRIIEDTHARALNMRKERIAGFVAHTDFTKAFNGHTLIPANCTPKSHTWTGKGVRQTELLL